jgi:hypothetical protein
MSRPTTFSELVSRNTNYKRSGTTEVKPLLWKFVLSRVCFQKLLLLIE